ncbi:hypothetical protein BDW22DRAFT_1363584 [Trametopsis cervina]|nr:hypothetical protein BDW22DRAFT_1363584 [Trametopsis cervina]
MLHTPVEMDVMAGEKVDCDAMLAYLLSMTLEHASERKSPAHGLLHECLHDVNELCSEPELTQLVRACTVKKQEESEWYTPLVELVNMALDKLETPQATDPNKGVARLRKVSKGPQSVLLARLADNRDYGEYPESAHSQTSPGLILITAATASRIYNGFNIDQFTLSTAPRHQYRQILTKTPDERVGWHEVLSSFEVQRNFTRKQLRDPPTTYTVPARVDPYTYSHMTGNVIITKLDGEVVSFPTADDKPTGRPGVPHESAIASSPSSSSSSSSSPKLQHPSSDFDLFGSVASWSKPALKRSSTDPDPPSQPPAKRSRGEGSSAQVYETAMYYDDDDTIGDGHDYPTKMVIYATERLGSLPVVTHSLGVLFKDDVFRLWWHDRHGVIQTEGVNFIQDLPRFLVLLLAIQRFNRTDWGVPPDFPLTPACGNESVGAAPPYEPTPRTNVMFPAKGDLAEKTVTVLWDALHSRTYRLRGRATALYNVEYSDDQGRSFVMKVSSPYKHHLPEAEIIQGACKLQPTTVKGESVNKFDHKKHLPFVLCHMEVAASDTTVVRKALDLRPETGRIMRITVFEKLHRFVEKGFKPKDLFRCWLEAVHCHYLLWANGYEHTDPSLENLRIRKVGETPYGVLNDFDLAITPGQSRGLGERTGTMPFVAVDLLCAEFWDKGSIERVYRHDLEGLLWVLAWIVLRLDASNDFKEALPNHSSNMDLWTADNVDFIRVFKVDLMRKIAGGDLGPHVRWQSPDAKFIWGFVSQSLRALHNRLEAYVRQKYQDRVRGLEARTVGGLDKKYCEKQFTPVGEYSSMQLGYLFVWANIREVCGDQYYEELKEAVGMDLDLPAADVAPALSQFVANPF